MLEELRVGSRVVGVKQTKRALDNGTAARIYLAEDADSRVVEPLETRGTEQGVPCVRVRSMKELGAACGIAVGSAAAALLKDGHV